MEQNNKNNTTHKRKPPLFRGKTKHILLLLPAILILTCILALPLASGQNQTPTIPPAYGQIQATALPQTNIINTKGDKLNLANPITLGTTTNNGISLTVIGSMTVTGNSILNGNLDISNAQRVILGSPLYANGTMTLTGDKIELGNSTNSGGSIIISGNNTWPAVNSAKGSLSVGNQSTGSRVYFNITNYYQYVDCKGGGYIGTTLSGVNALTLLSNDAIKVHSGELYIHSEWPQPLVNSIDIWIDHNWFNITATAIGIITIPVQVNLWGDPRHSNANYSGIANVTLMNDNGEFGLLGIGIGDTTRTRYMEISPGTIFESWGPWFAVGSSLTEGGVIVLNDSYIYMNSSSPIRYQFLDNKTGAAITLKNSPNYPKAEMYVSTTNQSISGLGDTTITNGGISTSGYSDIKNMNQITNGIFEFTGDMLINGDSTIEGDIIITGYNKLQAPIIVSGQMNVNNGLMSGTLTLNLTSGCMETNGTLNIVNGEMNILQGTMEMNSTGIYVYDATSTTIGCTITSTGIMNITGNSSIQVEQEDNIEISGYSYMEGLITVQGNMNINNGLTSDEITLTIDGTMETTGSMNITNGGISASSGSIVMNSTGAYITGDTISVTGEQINSVGTITTKGDITIKGDIEMNGNNYIKGPVSITGALNINSGTMTGTGTITVSSGYMQTVGNMKITNATITVSGTIVMDSSGTHIGSTTSITGDSITVTGMVTNAGSVKMSGTFVLLVPLSMTGMMLTNGITAMGGLGTITGAMNIMGNIMMSGMTVISGDNNIMGTMTVTPFGVSIYGMVGLTGIVYTSSMPNIGSSTVLELLSGSMMGMSIPHMSIMMNPLALVALGVLGVGTVYVVGRIVYFGIKERRTLIQLVRIYGREMGRSISGRVRRLFRRSS